MKTFGVGALSLVIGLVVGAGATFFTLQYFITQAMASENPSGPFAGQIASFKASLTKLQTDVDTDKNLLSIRGKVVAIDGATFTIDTTLRSGQKIFTFYYDSATQFLTIANDDALTRTPFDPSTLVIGEFVDVITNETIGSVENQHAKTVIRS